MAIQGELDIIQNDAVCVDWRDDCFFKLANKTARFGLGVVYNLIFIEMH